MAKRKRIYTPAAVRWEANPLWELAKIRTKELGITTSEAVRLIGSGYGVGAIRTRNLSN